MSVESMVIFLSDSSASLERGHKRRLFSCAHVHAAAACHARRMELRKASRGGPRAVPAFPAQAFLDSSGIAKTIEKYGRGETIFTQGDACEDVLYIQTGGVKLSVLSKTGREAVVAMLGPGDFFGEGCLAGQPVRMGSATALTPSVILLVRKAKMVRLLHQQHAMSDRFISHMLSRNIRIEEDLIDQLFNSSEKRLARTLLLLARYGKQDKPVRVVPKISQDTLAEMIGTTRSRVNFLLNKFKRLGFIEYNGEIPLKINSSLLSVVLQD
jgi:CRP/FNR family cyclic AMP-dependent transcriptional regulator